ncbi:Gfo/Idh/MocA family oxidoreductase [Endozoicomonas sp. SM1973]|uniref:Gfo/Idh/MocA family oxidoreductase n=1 Tax=Spartinivicinus marinus TaxID=2994442 RepID=A0A853IDX2_9GAMM|nr:Gfo/Idh/MocA family oxidoreductase [Spartinivicinus marinus]MCX4025946.1 Gfo/Idh/MocA family oxidoreductase [Spartinivicinus marinus]NYZ68131.1 Gfo/Idh/MocA family oxidoreductase [Spartinivicinus marinus]
MEKLRIGLIGTGYMGKAHNIAFKACPAVFPLLASIECEMLAEVNQTLAEQKVKELGFNRATGDWRTLVNDHNIDVVDICSPNYLHKEMALAAIAAGKHVYSEKPLALNAVDAKEMTEAAEKAGIKTLVGFNYVKNPVAQLVKEIIENGEIGNIVHFRGTHNEDYLADPNTPFSWRLKRELAGSGTLGDMGSHIINMAQYLVGDINEVMADLQTVIKERLLLSNSQTENNNQYAKVENDDQAHMMVRFSNGAIGTLESSRIACGRKMGLTYEITGTKGAIVFDQERLSELQLFTNTDPSNRQGFRTILVGPEHPDYAAFCVASGHGLGYNDQKIVEVRDLVEGICADKPMWPDFRAAYEVNKVLDAAELSYKEGRWIKLSEIE